MDLKERVSSRLSKARIDELCEEIRGNVSCQERLFGLTDDANRQIAYNAFWVLSRLVAVDNFWIITKRDILIDRVMAEQNDGIRRLILAVLLRLPFDKEHLRSDFVDYCLEKIPLNRETCAVRVYCLRLAFEQCKFYLELLQELQAVLAMLDGESLPAGLYAARADIRKKWKRCQNC